MSLLGAVRTNAWGSAIRQPLDCWRPPSSGFMGRLAACCTDGRDGVAGPGRRQPGPDLLRGRARQAMRRLPDPRLERQGHPLQAQPRWQPTGECRPPPRSRRADAGLPAHDRLRPTPHGRRKEQDRDHSLPQALRGAGNLRPFVPPTQDRSIRPNRRLTYIGALMPRKFLRLATYINQNVALARRRVIHVQCVAALRDLISVA
jgi:hypothetical protein